MQRVAFVAPVPQEDLLCAGQLAERGARHHLGQVL